MLRARADSLLVWIAIAHGALALACAIGLLVDSPRIGGLHPMVKPLKFAVSIGIFVATMALVLPMLSVSPRSRDVLRWLLAITMIVETAAVVLQALRGTASHYNEATGFDRAVWRVMLVAILAATGAMVAVAWAATARPLLDAAGRTLPPLSALAWRAGLWSFPLAAISGFAMGGRRQHTVGAADGGPGLPGVGWSVAHGDLRISHFLALHALQLLPLIALGVQASRLDEGGRWTVMLAAIALQTIAVGWTLWRAFGGRPPW